MEWIINSFIALLMTDITGTVFYVMGLVFWKIWFQRDVTWKRFCLFAVLSAYSMPLVFALIYGRHLVRWRGEGEIIGFRIFYSTPKSRVWFYVLGCLWFMTVLVILVLKCCQYLGVRKLCMGNIPEEDQEIQSLFDRICREMKLETKVRLCRNDMLRIPCMTYCHGAVVLLPYVRYTRKQAEVVLYHELCHYAERDLWIKNLGVLIAVVHGFNPLVHVMTRQISLICEESCDRMACRKGAEAFSNREYFQIIFHLMQDKPTERYGLFLLVDDELHYERRVKCMCKGREKKALRRGAAAVLSVCFLLGSSLTAYAAGDALTGECTAATQQSSAYHMMETEEAELDEVLRANGLDMSTVTVIPVSENLLDQVSRGVTTFDWQIPPNRTFMTSGFYVNKGDQVAISASGTPKSIEYWTGLQDPDDIMNYVSGKGVLATKITVQQNGTHYFFITNKSTTQTLDIQASVVK